VWGPTRNVKSSIAIPKSLAVGSKAKKATVYMFSKHTYKIDWSAHAKISLPVFPWMKRAKTYKDLGECHLCLGKTHTMIRIKMRRMLSPVTLTTFNSKVIVKEMPYRLREGGFANSIKHQGQRRPAFLVGTWRHLP
jgi:hypothetical protein